MAGEPRPTPQSPAPTTQPPAAAELAAPATEGFWSSDNVGDYDFPGMIGSYHTRYRLVSSRLPVVVDHRGTAAAPGNDQPAGNRLKRCGRAGRARHDGAFRRPGCWWLRPFRLSHDRRVMARRLATMGFRVRLLFAWRAFRQFQTKPLTATPSLPGRSSTSRPTRQSALIAAYPGVATGTVTANASDYFQSFGLSVSRCLCDYRARAPFNPESLPSDLPLVSSFRLDLLGAFRYYALFDSVNVGENLVYANFARSSKRERRQSR